MRRVAGRFRGRSIVAGADSSSVASAAMNRSAAVPAKIVGAEPAASAEPIARQRSSSAFIDARARDQPMATTS
jgi:hypothetical protein